MTDPTPAPVLLPQPPTTFGKPLSGWRRRLYVIIFEADTSAGRHFDVILVAAIVFSILVVVLGSIPALGARFPLQLNVLEWGFTLMFTVEYVARLSCVRHPLRYATSFFGIIDLLSILPTYFTLLVPEAAAFLDIRILRLLRIFRIFKLTMYVAEYVRLGQALRASARKILIFLAAVMMAVLIMEEHGFTSIPTAMYWAVVTMTTVGYGDLTPHTGVGKVIASFMMLLGWGILAVPTGIVTAEMTSQRMLQKPTTRSCPACMTPMPGTARSAGRRCRNTSTIELEKRGSRVRGCREKVVRSSSHQDHRRRSRLRGNDGFWGGIDGLLRRIEGMPTFCDVRGDPSVLRT